MNTPGHLTRRDALKVLGAGAAFVGLGALSKEAFGADATQSAVETKQPFTLPKLGYAYDALEPHIDARTMEIHHSKHHQAYIDNANKALADFPDLQKLSGEQLLKNLGNVPEKIRTAIRNNVGGHLNHTFFWQTLAPGAGGEPNGDLAAAFVKDFGSLAAFKTAFADAAMKRFGSGWAWLALNREGALTVTSSANQDSPLIDGLQPVLGLDVWEHAYYLKFQNRRNDYITAFWNVVNWSQVSANFGRAGTV